MMIGPSAPNGPPEPIEMADESGLSTATLGCIRLRPIRIASIASGMPWPRIRSEPYRAISPMIRPPEHRHQHRGPAQRVVRRRCVAGARAAGNRTGS